MKNKQVRKALKRDTPNNSMYAHIPDNRMRALKKFATRFCFTEERIKSVLEHQKR